MLYIQNYTEVFRYMKFYELNLLETGSQIKKSTSTGLSEVSSPPFPATAGALLTCRPVEVLPVLCSM